jgi:CheY-like chemotaxis protein
MTQDDSRTGSLDGLRVMVIDDSKTIRRTAETLLKREGADVVTATDGFEALERQIRLDAARTYIEDREGPEKGKRRPMDLLHFVRKYAPAEDGNNPGRYLGFVCRKTGMTPDYLLKDLVGS